MIAAPRTGTVSRRVEHVDTDGYGVVHFSRYAAFAETAALELLEQIGTGLQALDARGLEVRVREIKLSYAAPARVRDELVLDAQLAHAGEARLRVSILISRQTGPAAMSEMVNLVSGYLELVLVDRASGQPRLIPEDVRCLLINEKTSP
jgi:acyl-CoA thioester hydrolase